MSMDQKEASKKSFEILVDFAKQITTISAAILSLFATIVSAKIIALSPASRFILILIFFVLVLSIFGSFWTILATAGTLNAISQDKQIDNPNLNVTIFASNIRIPLWITVVSFIFGLILLGFAALLQ